MQWHSLSEFLEMGGYALYVWGSFGITALVIAGEIWQVRAQRRAVLRNLSAALGSESHLQQDIAP
ncbi:MAG: hypothetical protein Fur007_07920 [Rhodoferax sp.]